MRSASDAPVPDTIEGLRAQNRAYRSLCASLEEIQARHTAQGRQYQEAIATLDSEREANARLTDELTRLQSEVEALRVALEPFTMHAFEKPLVDEEGWTDLGIGWSRDRIVDWFGPSDFRRARSALTGAG